MIQDKAQSEANGMSFSRTATPYWIIWVAPHFERTVRRVVRGVAPLGRGES